MTSPRLLLRCLLLLLVLVACSASAVVPSPWTPRPGDYVWRPDVAPAGPIVIIVSLPLQQVHVYRNGVRIGASSISSGKPGHETPVGLFTILQKEATHRSNLYDDAPMPWMQRLTWDGVALHAGTLPGRPASHGCIRLPPQFAKLLFAATRTGDTVVVTDRDAPPGVTAGSDVLRGTGAGDGAAGGVDFWMPELSPTGPVSVVMSLSDARLVVTRNGRRIGQAAIHVDAGLALGTHAYVLLDGAADGPNPLLPDRRARRWMAVDLAGDTHETDPVKDAIDSGRIVVPSAIAGRVDDVLQPGATVLVTDAPLGDAATYQRIELEDGTH